MEESDMDSASHSLLFGRGIHLPGTEDIRCFLGWVRCLYFWVRRPNHEHHQQKGTYAASLPPPLSFADPYSPGTKLRHGYCSIQQSTRLSRPSVRFWRHYRPGNELTGAFDPNDTNYICERPISQSFRELKEWRTQWWRKGISLATCPGDRPGLSRIQWLNLNSLAEMRARETIHKEKEAEKWRYSRSACYQKSTLAGSCLPHFQ